ncbi:hypothetical protein OH76DRAFT_1487324 [Lentinus brumalis]|uniref:Uncharacterized protein n=1 Tax=Lentinus brumalis TaxID=2498619 RepID=A0A371CV01_9APHY|nr:hypothetical protein OH76DRAFT_1487324 [Polyporus brumalis]
MATQGDPNAVLPPSMCRYSSIGLNSLVSLLRDLPQFQGVPESRLRGAAIGFLVAGAKNGNHDVALNQFHALCREVNAKHQPLKWRQGLRDLQLAAVMDHICVLDQASGGASFFIHCPGTRPPGTAPVAKEAKMEVYLPKPLMTRPEVAIALSYMVQYFAERIAVPAMERWDAASDINSWGSTATAQPYVDRGADMPIIPPSTTPHHVFYGRVPGQLEQLIAANYNIAQPAPPSVATATTSDTQADPEHAPGVPAMPTDDKGKGRATEDGEIIRMVSPDGKPHIKLAHSSLDPYTPEDLVAFAEAHYDSQGRLKTGASEDEVRELRDMVAALQARIFDLEEQNTAQEIQILGLRAALNGDRVRAFENSRVPGTPGRSSTADTFGQSSSRSPAPRAQSTTSFASVSSVSSVSASTPSTPTRSRVGPAEANAATPLVMSPQLATPARIFRHRWFIFGPATELVIAAHGLPKQTHSMLQDVADEYPVQHWVMKIRQNLFGCSMDVAKELVGAMKNDMAGAQQA